MTVASAVWSAFRRAFLPDWKDLAAGVVLGAAAYYALNFPLQIFILPLILTSAIMVFLLRRMWRLLVVYWCVRNAAKGVCKVKKLFVK
jgi:hypothetical protein